MKKRVLSAAIIIFTSAVLLISQHTIIFTFVLALLSLIGVYEIFRAMGLVNDSVMLLICSAFAGFLPFCGFFDSPLPLYIAAFFYIAAMLCLILWRWRESGAVRVGFAFFISALISLAFSNLSALRNLGTQSVFTYQKSDSTYFLVLMLISSWGTDVGGFLIGSFFGKHKFAPSISPKKTIEGVFGGIVFGILGFIITSAIYTSVFAKNAKMNIPVLLLYGLIVSVAAIFGDLAASAIKRSFQIKDFGNLIPGHGGILDRFDSVLFVTPLLYILFQLLPIIIR